MYKSNNVEILIIVAIKRLYFKCKNRKYSNIQSGDYCILVSRFRLSFSHLQKEKKKKKASTNVAKALP